MTKLHTSVAIMFGLILPVGSYLTSAGKLAFTMYARAPEYRLEVLVIDHAHRARSMAPTELARGARPSVVTVVAGADHWRTAPGTTDLRVTLPRLAAHACGVTRASSPLLIELTLQERAENGAPIRTTRTTATCSP